MTYNGKTAGEGNVHVARYSRVAAKLETDRLVALYHRLPTVRGRFTTRQAVVRAELEARGLSLRDLGIDPPRVET